MTITKAKAEAGVDAAYAAFTTISAKIRYLAASGMKRGDIAKFMTEKEGRLVRYQHVRNVLITPLKGQ